MRSRVVTGVAVVAAVAAGGVGGALIGVPGPVGRAAVPAQTTRLRPRPADPGRAARGPMHDARPCSTPRPRRSTSRPQQLRDKLSDGKTTIADVAKQQNVAVNDGDRRDGGRRPRPHRRHRQQAVAEVRRVGPGGPGAGSDRASVPGWATAGFGRSSAPALDAVAKALGITTDELKTDLAQGPVDRRHREGQEPRRQQGDRHARRRRDRRRSTKR